MLRVGLTGGIACGKNLVRRLLAERGAFTLDADAMVHRLLETAEVAHQIATMFGDEALGEEGAVDRGRLGRIVFSDPGARRRLEAILHPKVISETKRHLEEAERRGEPVAVVDAALMIETGTYRDYDCVVVVDCPASLQIQRLMERDGLALEEARLRVEAQLPIEEKKKVADYVIDNSGSLLDTERQVARLWQVLEERAARC